MSHMNNSVQQLTHVRRTLPKDGQVVVLDPGSTLDAEAMAMLQALHSRSTEGIDGHLAVLAERGPDKFMSTYYVGYGHKSIGDCGHAVVFIEGVSMLAAKAIQDSQLYNGQESSTRYIDFAQQTFLNPVDTEAGENIHKDWRAFYLKAIAELKDTLPDIFPREEEENENVYRKAIAARAFDIARGFLPAGASTNLAWSGTLRQFADRVQQLRHHPLQEVRTIAEVLEDALIESYPNSFNQEKKRYEDTEAYLQEASHSYYYHNPDSPELEMVRDNVDQVGLEQYHNLLRNRPKKTELPKWLGVYGDSTFAFTLDFASFRDIQRHRAVTQRMPLLTEEIGFHEWYLSSLPATLQTEARELLETQSARIAALETSKEVAQYYHPMGYQISNYLSGDLPALVYLVEIRATSLVHPTLATRAGEMAKMLGEKYKNTGLTLHLDPDPGRFNAARGTHDIEKRD